MLARVGERVITEADLKRELAHLPALLRGRYARRERQRELLEAMIRVELLAHLAREAGYEQRPAAHLAFERALVAQLTLSRDERASLDQIKLLTPLPAEPKRLVEPTVEPPVEPNAPPSPLSPFAHPQEEP